VQFVNVYWNYTYFIHKSYRDDLSQQDFAMGTEEGCSRNKASNRTAKILFFFFFFLGQK
jgi:hypothetical protein